MELISGSSNKHKNGRQLWVFKCSHCGANVEKTIHEGRGNKSCGCMINAHKTKHGWCGTRLYRTWEGIKNRCLNNGNKYYHNYGGRGILLCDEWYKFIPFKDWALSSGYRDDLEIDRIDNGGDYEPSNCRFVTHAQNGHNTRTAKMNWDSVDEMRGLYKTNRFLVKELAFMFGIDASVASRILRNLTWKERERI